MKSMRRSSVLEVRVGKFDENFFPWGTFFVLNLKTNKHYIY